MAVDRYGYVYVADTGNHAIRVVSPSGRVQTLAGTGSSGYKDGLASGGAQFSSPTDIAVWHDWTNNGAPVLFVADTDNHRIRRITGEIVHDLNGSKEWINVLVDSHQKHLQG